MATTAGAGSITSRTHNSLGISFAAASGGTAPYTYRNFRLTDYNHSPPASGVELVHTGLTFTDTGLASDTCYHYRQIVTDAGAVSATTPAASQTGAPTLRVALISPIPFQIGDSNTSGGSPQSVKTMGTVLESLLGASGISSAASGQNGGGIEAYIDPDTLLATALLDTRIASINTAEATDVQARIGTNDEEETALWKSMMAALATIIIDQCPTVERFWYLDIPFKYSPLIAPQQAYHAKFRAYQTAMDENAAALDDPDGVRVYRGNPWVYDGLMSRPELFTDGTHLTQGGYDWIGTRDAEWWHQTVILGAGANEAVYADATDVREDVDRGDGTLGTLDLPTESDVRDGTTFDGAAQTGTLDLPTEANVRDGTTYDNGTKTGTLEPGEAPSTLILFVNS
jgi:hypothetical protein